MKTHPNVNPAVTICIGLLGDDLTIFVEDSQVENSITIGIALFAHELIILKIKDGVPLAGSFDVAQTFREPALGKDLNHIQATVLGGVFIAAYDFVALKIDDSADFAVAVQIFLLFD